ncbi:negative regulation of toll-like receptor 5 signaling pathway [Branchiostoma belcheri]|nr:negative regulation of toll-like receptor 5 signaling pathway [Branchiostoma belcheri]
MVRATSLASFNSQKSGRLQCLVKDDIDSQSICFGGTHRYTQRIPAVVASSDIGDVMADLLDGTTQQHLERRGVLNRYMQAHILYPYPPHAHTHLVPIPSPFRYMQAHILYPYHPHSGNGDCLLHAISTYMWGIQDSDQTLQQLLCRALTEPTNLSRSLRDRFMEHLMGNSRRQSSQEDLQRKWEAVLSVVSSAFTPQVDNDLLLKAFEVYIFTMAQILRRPIVVLAEDVPLTREGGSFSLSGIYLPLHWPAEECVKNPIMLAYHNQQFYPLLSTQPPQQATSGPIDAVPLVSQNGESLQVHLLLPEEAAHVQEYVNQHIHTTLVQDRQGNSMVAARMGTLTPPDEYNLLLDVFQQAAEGPNPAEASEAFPGPAGLENRNGAAGNQGASIFCTQGAEGLTSQGAELDQQMLRISIQKEAVSQGNSHPANASTQLPCTTEAMMFTSSPHNSDDNPHNLDVHNMAAVSKQRIQTSHSTIQGEVNNHRATSSQQGGWQQNDVLPGDVSAAAESIQDESQASSSIANGRSSRAANDNRAQWEATGAKPKQPSGSRSKEGSRKMGNRPARDNSICKTTGCPGKLCPVKEVTVRSATPGSLGKRGKQGTEDYLWRIPQQMDQHPRKDRPEKHHQLVNKDNSRSQAWVDRGRNSSIPQGRETSKEQMSMQPVNTPTSTQNTSGSRSATVNSTPMRPQVPQATDPRSRPETAFLPNSGPPSSTIYASSSGQSSPTSTHGAEPSVPQSTNNVSTGTLRMHHNAGEEPLGTSLYHARTTDDDAVQENHPYIPADHLVKCSAPNCDRMVNKDISDSLCQVCHQVLGQINQASLPNNGTLNLGQGSSVGTNTRRAATDADAAVTASDVTSPKYKDSAANLPMRNQPAVHRPPGLQSAHQRAYQQQRLKFVVSLHPHQTGSIPTRRVQPYYSEWPSPSYGLPSSQGYTWQPLEANGTICLHP